MPKIILASLLSGCDILMGVALRENAMQNGIEFTFILLVIGIFSSTMAIMSLIDEKCMS